MNAPFPGQNDGWQQGQQPPSYGQQQYGQQYGQPELNQQYLQPGYGQPGLPAIQYGNVTQNLSLNFWLSVFFGWIPALIFFLIDKDKVPAITRAYAAANLNFQILRVIVGFVGGILLFIPVVGWIAYPVAIIALFVMQIMAAIKVEDCARRGEPAENLYPFNLPMVK